jgi:hypothetical protein
VQREDWMLLAVCSEEEMIEKLFGPESDKKKAKLF